MHKDAATIYLAALVGPGGGCPGHRRWESAGKEGGLRLTNTVFITIGGMGIDDLNSRKWQA